MIRLKESGRQRDGTRWRGRSSRAVLSAGAVYYGLGGNALPGYLWIEDGKWARCEHESELEPVDGSEGGFP